jgi:hypothetical protein
MSGGGRVQLTATGMQDVMLTQNPQMSYFLKNYKRHTKFAMQTAEIPFDQEPSFGGKVHATIPRLGDLVKEMYVRITLPEMDQNILTEFDSVQQKSVGIKTYPTYVDSVGNAVLRRVDLSIGGQVLSSLNGEYMEIYNDTFVPRSHTKAIENMVGRTYIKDGAGPASNVVYRTENGFSANGAFPRTFIVPLRFWNSQDVSLSIPLVALQKQELEITIQIEDVERLVTSKLFDLKGRLKTNIQLGGKPLEIEKMSLLVDYIQLSDEEATYFTNSPMQYTITQVQGIETTVGKNEDYTTLPKQIRPTFSNPVKELFIITQDDPNRPRSIQAISTLTNDYFNFKNSVGTDHLKSLELLFNGEIRIQKEIADGFYLRVVQPLQSHTKVPERFIYNYSFALDPENYAPTGQVNFSRIKDILFNLTLNPPLGKDVNTRIYVKSYNVLVIQDGIAGVLFNYGSGSGN